jgi:6-phosphogluconate dehydrogenase
MVLDQAGQKGTGKWTVQAALDLSVPVPTIAAAMDARLLSGRKRERLAAIRQLGSPAESSPRGDAKELIASVHDALHASKICAYAQGMSLIRAASDAYGWGVHLKEMARIWKGGCIIRARLLDSIMQAYEQQPDLSTLLLDSNLALRLLKAEPGWRRAVDAALQSGVPIPAMAAALSYFDTYRAAGLPQNLTQAQRDYFGAHTYQRTDQPEADFVHTDWPSLARKAGSKSGGLA